MKSPLFVVLGLAVALTASPVAAIPREVRIVDFWGLLRASRSMVPPARVVVKLGGAESVPEFDPEQAPVLANQRGITSDIKAERLSPRELLFRNVGEGTWRIVLKHEGLSVDAVTIEEDRP